MSITGSSSVVIELEPGVVRRLVVDLVRLSVWIERQSAAEGDEERRRSLNLTHLSCRLTAEMVNEVVLSPHVVRSGGEVERASTEEDPNPPQEGPRW